MQEGQEKPPEEAPVGSEPQETKPPQSPPSSSQAGEMQQPSLVAAGKKGEDKWKLSPPPKSFIIASITILLTIIAGISVAILIGRATNRGLKSEPTPEPTPRLTSRPTQATSEPAVPPLEPNNQAIPANGFESLIDLHKEASPSQESIATQPATPTQ